VELRFRYDPSKKGRLLFENPNAGKPEELVGQIILFNTLQSPLMRIPWLGSVFAQPKVSAETAIANLEADDPVIRLNARRQLASLGPEAIGGVDRALTKPESSYRIKLGVMVAANQMRGFKPESLTPSAWCEIWRSAQTGDDAMKAQANLLLKKRSNPISASTCVVAKSKSTKPPKR
jgi:hypothetical protein